MARLATFSNLHRGATNPQQEDSGLARVGTLTDAPERGYRANGAQGYTQLTFTGAAATDFYFRAYMRWGALPSGAGQDTIMTFINGGAGASCAARINWDGKLQLYQLLSGGISSVALIGETAAEAIQPGQEYMIELRHRMNGTLAADTIELRLNGVVVAASTATNIVDGNPTAVTVGIVAGSMTSANLDWHSCALNNSAAGGVQTGYPGQGYVDILLPAALSAAGAWRKPGGAATDLHTSVDNRPPVGIAHSTNVADAEKQIYNITSGGSTTVDLHVQSYNERGIAGPISLIQLLGRVGTSSTTMAGSMGIVSNPTSSPATDNIQYTSGAVSGTDPTNWGTRKGTVQYAPTVTKGTRPVIRFVKSTLSVNAALVDLAGIIVEHVPMVLRPPTVNSQAVMRAATS